MVRATGGDPDNPVGLDGLEFIEYATRNSFALEQAFLRLGFQKIGRHKRKALTLYRQNQINFVANNETAGFAAKFCKQHGPSICAIGLRVRNAQRAFEICRQRGARPLFEKAETAGHRFPAIYGIGDSAIYFVDRFRATVHFDDDFRYLQPELQPPGRGLIAIENLSAAVPKGDLGRWAEFFTDIFNFSEIQAFAIKGQSTGLVSKRLRSPCRNFTLHLSEPTEGKSQVQEYLDEYRGAGVQRIAFETLDIERSVRGLRAHGVAFFEDAELGQGGVHTESDPYGMVRQAFTKNLVGPIAFEIIERRGRIGLPVDCVRAMFETMERDQQRRGYI